MRFAEHDDQGSRRILFTDAANPARRPLITPSDAAHIVAGMTVDAVNRNAEVASGIKEERIALPVATPFIVVADAFEERLLGNGSGHPTVEQLLMAREDRLDAQRNI